MSRRTEHDAQARKIRARSQRSQAAKRGWETRRARVEQTLNAVEQIAERMRETAEGLALWYRNRDGAGNGRAGVHPMHAANRLVKLADQLAARRIGK